MLILTHTLRSGFLLQLFCVSGTFNVDERLQMSHRKKWACVRSGNLGDHSKRTRSPIHLFESALDKKPRSMGAEGAPSSWNRWNHEFVSCASGMFVVYNGHWECLHLQICFACHSAMKCVLSNQSISPQCHLHYFIHDSSPAHATSPWWCRQKAPLKRWSVSTHDAASQKTAIFVLVVRIWNLTQDVVIQVVTRLHHQLWRVHILRELKTSFPTFSKVRHRFWNVSARFVKLPDQLGIFMTSLFGISVLKSHKSRIQFDRFGMFVLHAADTPNWYTFWTWQVRTPIKLFALMQICS
jgi:hypothetical protein